MDPTHPLFHPCHERRRARPWAARSSMRASCGEVVDARELLRRTVARFLEDLGYAGVEEREAIDDAIRHMRIDSLLIRPSMNSFTSSIHHGHIHLLESEISARESEIEKNKMKAEEAEAENEGLRKEL
ncbi:hypothetical protein Fmac_021062 [Flemingia macrophylla]|uniref:Uncharacterized protein n=1 Tax=Flemingia macrophylla TaxID=520843 RepID=A0ABD1LXI4_9FABA